MTTMKKTTNNIKIRYIPAGYNQMKIFREVIYNRIECNINPFMTPQILQVIYNKINIIFELKFGCLGNMN